MSFNLTINRFSLENARAFAELSSQAYIAPPTIIGESTKTQVVIRDAGNCILVGFPGTHDARDVLTDVEAWFVNVPSIGAKLHYGFYRGWSSIARQLQFHLNFIGDKPVVVYGHSLGGALAVIAAKCLRELAIKVHSVHVFGCPRVGDNVFQELYNRTRLIGSPFETLGEATMCVINDCDGVARVPGWLDGYRRPGRDYLISGKAIHEDPSVLWRLKSDLKAYWKICRAKWWNPAAGLQLLATDHYIEHYIAALAEVKTKTPSYGKN